MTAPFEATPTGSTWRDNSMEPIAQQRRAAKKTFLKTHGARERSGDEHDWQLLADRQRGIRVALAAPSCYK
jgi:hypothetical protein